MHDDYRRKPQAIRVGRHEFPKPITEAPEEGTVYWTIEVGGRNGFYVEHYKWLQNGKDESCIRQGLIHLTRENLSQILYEVAMQGLRELDGLEEVDGEQSIIKIII